MNSANAIIFKKISGVSMPKKPPVFEPLNCSSAGVVAGYNPQPPFIENVKRNGGNGSPSVLFPNNNKKHGKAMSKNTVEFQPDDEIRAQKWSAALRKRYDCAGAAKKIARDFDVSPRTAQGWLCGQGTPFLKYLERGVLLFGFEFLADVLGDVLPLDCSLSKAVRLEEALKQNAHALQKIEAEIEKLKI